MSEPMRLGTVNGVPVISAERVPWKDDDDAHVRLACESRGLVLFDRGGKSDAVVVGGRAVIWEREGERFRSFPVDAPRAGVVVVGGKRGRLWSVAVPSSDIGAMVRMEWDELAGLDHPQGAAVEVVLCGMLQRAPMTKRELRRLLGVAVDWPGMDVAR